ncbi:hypothetical protein GCM10029978_046190 [Actinoallomurus acanthiterrae]
MADIPGARRWRVPVAALIALVSFLGVLAAIEAMALRGQVDFGRYVLRLNGRWLAIPPIALEGGTLAAATLTLWAVLNHDSAALSRLMTMAFIGAAACANYQGAKHAGRSTLAADYLAGASVAAYLMWHNILTRLRRSDLRQAEALEDPLPRFRLLRWMFAFQETYAAFKVAIRQNITRPADAIAQAQRELLLLPPAGCEEELPPERLTALAAERGGKRRAVAYAAAAAGSYEPAAVQRWLAERDVDVDLSYVSRTLTRITKKQHALEAAEVQK